MLQLLQIKPKCLFIAIKEGQGPLTWWWVSSGLKRWVQRMETRGLQKKAKSSACFSAIVHGALTGAKAQREREEQTERWQQPKTHNHKVRAGSREVLYNRMWDFSKSESPTQLSYLKRHYYHRRRPLLPWQEYRTETKN